MCGILGWVGPAGGQPDDVVLGAALDLIRHRGPDGGHAWLGTGVCLGHRRLAIIDLGQQADQPMRVEHLVLVFNGEIYNYRAVRQELEAMGHGFTTRSDSEVLLRAWLQWGRDGLARLEGMFAFAIWNRRTRSLTLARDRYGEKPLFIHRRGDGVAFSSELPPLVRLAGGCLQEDERALGLYFMHSYIPAPQGIFKDVEQLEPGTWLEWDEIQGVRQGRYYDLRTELAVRTSEPSIVYTKAVEQLRERLAQAVKLRIESADVPVATLLSGGIDSSVITVIASQASVGPLSAYSLGFPQDPEFDETDHALAVARTLSNVRHHIVEATEARVLDFAPQVLDQLGEPFADSSLLPTAYLCAHIEEKVALGGDAADELFAGYGIYPAIVCGASLPGPLRRLLTALPTHGNPHAIAHPRLRAAALFHKHLRNDTVDSYLSWRTYADPAMLAKLGIDMSERPRMRERLAAAGSGRLRDIQMLDLIFNLPNDMLKKVDYASMISSVEVRLPYLDSGLVHWALALPDDFRMARGIRKRILRDAFTTLLPEQILTRSKKGFLLPVCSWFRHGRLRDELVAMIDGQTMFDRTPIRAVLDRHAAGRADDSVFLWALYVYLRWRGNLARWARHSARDNWEVAG